MPAPQRGAATHRPGGAHDNRVSANRRTCRHPHSPVLPSPTATPTTVGATLYPTAVEAACDGGARLGFPVRGDGGKL
ncbi:MAG: hypothetical protein HZY76_19580 [Anaerolineae bacterium]|nr:MAG: hypothetical protein HZY76_19580 [Anaerolineae bacterium]